MDSFNLKGWCICQTPYICMRHSVLDGVHLNANERDFFLLEPSAELQSILGGSVVTNRDYQSSGAVWKSRWPSWAFRPNEPFGFRGRKSLLNHAHTLVSACPWCVSRHPMTLRSTTAAAESLPLPVLNKPHVAFMDVKQHERALN